MIYKKLLNNIENKGIINGSGNNLSVTEPLQINNDNISIKQESLDKWNSIETNYYTKQEIDNQELEQNNKISQNTYNINETWEKFEKVKPFIITNKQDIADIKIEQQTQNTNITNNTNTINKLIQELRDSNIINYVGEYQAGTTYKLGQVVSFQNKMYLCKVESTTNEPTNNNDWDLLSAPEIDLTNYYNKTQIDQQQQTQDTLIATNETNITTIKNDLGDLGDQVQTIQGQLNINQDKINYLNDWVANVEVTHNISIKENNLHIEETKLDHPNTYDLDLSQLPIIKEHTQQIQDNHNDINDLMTTKQDTLIAGDNITISNNTISTILPSINITTNETLIPNYKVNNKPVYAKYVEYTNKGTFNYTIATNVDCFISNGISVLSNAKETYANITGGMVINSFDANYAFKVYLDGSGNIKIYSSNISERLTFKGVVYYTKK